MFVSRILNYVTAVSILLITLSVTAIAFSGEGLGTEVNPYNISTLGELNETRNNLTAHYQLINNINASETENWNDGSGFNPIGNWDASLEGVFNGNGNIIRGLYMDSGKRTALFALVGGSGVIKNVELRDVNITGKKFVGALAGESYGSIFNSSSTGRIACPYHDSMTGEGNLVGGLVGLNDGGSSAGVIESSYSNCTVSGYDEIGGLAGRSSGKIYNSYASGSVSGNNQVSGLVGENAGLIENSYSTTSVSGIYGFVDYNTGTCSNCFWDIETSNQDETECNATGKNTSKMKDFSTFDSAGWNITTTTEGNPTNGYPFLSWQLGSSPTWYIYEEETTTNTAPNKPTDPEPGNGSTEVSTTVQLNVTVTDPDGDSMNITFYNSVDDTTIGTDNHVPNGSTATAEWSELNSNTTYKWYTTANDGSTTNTSDTWTFTTKTETTGNSPPEITSHTPSNGEKVGNKTHQELTITVEDPDGQDMNVTFINASNGNTLNTNTSIPSGTTVKYNWTELNTNTTYEWYVNVTDGNTTVQGGPWEFTTQEQLKKVKAIPITAPEFTPIMILALFTITVAFYLIDGDE